MLLLLRHAKSSWDDTALTDHDRPLKKRGRKAANRIGEHMRDCKLVPQLVICSTAVRARQTLDYVLDASGMKSQVEFQEELYHCSADQFAVILKQVDDCNQSVMLVGHNPGMEEFLEKLVGEFHAVPTGTLTQVSLDIESWSDFDLSTVGTLIDLWRPRELESD